MRPDVTTECPDQTLLLEFLNEQLTASELSLLNAHVSTCPECSQRLADLVDSHWGSGTISMLSVTTDRPPPRFDGYETLEPIAVGGMGAVWRVRDHGLGRELAVKIIKPALADRPAFRARFLREAQLSARLAHPNIVPVHSQGELEDGRPYYTMKLVEGETLSELLKRQQQAQSAITPLLHIFQQVCHAVAFAHRHGVVHRDLKPLNVMVGVHGEVQLMDWGLAKVLHDSEELAISANETELSQEDTTCRPSAVETEAGDVVGTLAYMPPEQARGDKQLTCAADVFSLGAILCEIITGQPAYRGENINDLMQKALAVDLSDVHRLLDQSGSDPKLIELTRNCLAEDPNDRPADAGALAAQLAAYRMGVEQQLEQQRLAAEHERGAAQVREQALKLQAKWERRRRRLVSGLSLMMVIAALSVAGLAIGRIQRQQAQQQVRTAADRSITQAEVALWQNDFPLAEAELKRTQALLQADADYRGNDVQRLNDSLKLARDLQRVRHEYFTWSNAWFDCCTALDRYQHEFEQAKWDIEDDTNASIAQRIKQSPVKTRLLAAMDDWAWLAHREAQRTEDEDQRNEQIELRDRLLQVARMADPDNATANELRDGELWDDTQALDKLVDTIDPQQHSAEILVLLGKLLPDEARADYFARCQHDHADDFWLNAELGRALLDSAISALPDERAGELPIECPPMLAALLHDCDVPTSSHQMASQAVGYYRAALVEHPHVTGLRLDLASAVALTGDWETSIAICCAALAGAADDTPPHELAEVHLQLGLSQLRLGQLDEATNSPRKAGELDEY